MSIEAKKEAVKILTIGVASTATTDAIIGKLAGFNLKGFDLQAPKGDMGDIPRAFVEFKGEDVDLSLSTIGNSVYATKFRIGFRTGMDGPGNSYDMAEALKEALLTSGLDFFIVKDVRIRAPAGRELWYGLDIIVSG